MTATDERTPARPYRVGDDARLLHRERMVRQSAAGSSAVDCTYQFPAGRRCALARGHAAAEDGVLQHVAIDSLRVLEVNDVPDPESLPDTPSPDEITDPVQHAYAHWLGKRVAIAVPRIGEEGDRGRVVIPVLSDWHLASRPARSAKVLVAWSNARRDWRDPQSLVECDEAGRPLYAQQQPEAPRGLRCRVLVPRGTHSANGGISARVQEVTLVGEEIEKAGMARLKATPGAPAVTLGKAGGRVHARPIVTPEGAVGPMASGAWIYDRDLRDVLGVDGPIPLHDRFESPELYAQLSSD